MKKLLCFILSSVTLASVFAFTACDNGGDDNTSDVKTNTLVYELNDDDAENPYYVVTGLNVSSADVTYIANGEFESLKEEDRKVVIPAYPTANDVDKFGNACNPEYPVKEIAADAFTSQLIVKSVKVEADASGNYVLEKINESAFAGCANIEEVELPFVGESNKAYNEKRLFGYVFGDLQTDGMTAYTQNYNDTDTKECYLPDSLKKVTITNQTFVPAYAFYNLSSIKEITFTTVSEIGNYAFYGCSSLNKLGVSDVQEIGESALQNCSSILTFDFSTVTAIYANAFNGCSLLGYGEGKIQTVVLGGTNPVLLCGNGIFQNCTSIRAIDVTLDSTDIWQNCFYGCAKLEKATFTGVNKIQVNAFGSCDKLTSANVSGTYTAETGAFDF